jgi:hypothetical protein
MTSSKPQAVGLKQSILIIKAGKHSYLSLNIGVLKEWGLGMTAGFIV